MLGGKIYIFLLLKRVRNVNNLWRISKLFKHHWQLLNWDRIYLIILTNIQLNPILQSPRLLQTSWRWMYTNLILTSHSVCLYSLFNLSSARRFYLYLFCYFVCLFFVLSVSRSLCFLFLYLYLSVCLSVIIFIFMINKPVFFDQNYFGQKCSLLIMHYKAWFIQFFLMISTNKVIFRIIRDIYLLFHV